MQKIIYVDRINGKLALISDYNKALALIKGLDEEPRKLLMEELNENGGLNTILSLGQYVCCITVLVEHKVATIVFHGRLSDEEAALYAERYEELKEGFMSVHRHVHDLGDEVEEVILREVDLPGQGEATA